MESPEPLNNPEAPTEADPADELPGDHPLEIAGRRGIGPLSAKSREVWHGNAEPCVSCGQLVERYAAHCDHCGQDLREEMLQKMRAHAGPWYVLEHLRPFPGVSLDRIVRQIRRGLLTETSIIRGPETDYQWRFAVETPGLCRYFGRCWKCHAEVAPGDTVCTICASPLTFEHPPVRHAPVPTSPPQASTAEEGTDPRQSDPPSKDHLRELTAVLGRGEVPTHDPIWDEPPRIGRVSVTWIAALLLIAAVVALSWVTHIRNQAVREPASPTGPAVLTPTVPPDE